MSKALSRVRKPFAAAAALALVALIATAGATGVEAAPTPATFTVRGSAEQVDVTGLTGGEKASLLAPDGSTVATQAADSLGGLLFRNVTPGTGYKVRATDTGAESGAVTVHSTASTPWDPSFETQPIANSGYQYLTTRDGTQLAIDVHLPQEVVSALPAVGQLASILPKLPLGGTLGPNGVMQYPTVIEYSGYGYADPSGPQNGIATVLNLMGYAVVDVNMRGTGCSGGAYDFFEPLQNLDGYDVIETIAHQPWVLHNKVGMIGISYGGISQLFTAQTQPPDLAAIAPFSVIDATATTLYPGGILNTGFAVAWAQERVHDALPATADGGQHYAYERIQGGDKICAANQALHGEAVNLMAKIRANSYYNPATADPLDPDTFVNKIDVPVFMACQWEDEQTGGHCPELVQHMTGTNHKWFTFTNGAHIDSLDPATFDRWIDFLDLYVKREAPALDPFSLLVHVPLISGLVYQTAMNVPGNDTVALPTDPLQNPVAYPTYGTALAAFEKLPEVRILFDNGVGATPSGGTAENGNPYPAFEQSFATLPIPGTKAQHWYLGAKGALTDQPPSAAGVDWYTSNPKALAATDYKGNTGGGGLWGIASQWTWNWQQNPAGTAVSYVTSPLTANTTVIGSGAVTLWVRSSTPNVDLQATVSEVRPDGRETFVQDGWLRGSERKLSTGAANLFKRPGTAVAPVPEFTQAAASVMPAGQFTKVTIPLYYEGHVYRAGSRIRITVAAPGGQQPVWAFAETEPSTGTAKVEVAHSASMPSSLVLPVVPGVNVPTGLPACPGLRSEPCRAYEPFTNQTEGATTPVTTAPTTPAAPTTAAPGSAAPSSPGGATLGPGTTRSSGGTNPSGPLAHTGADLARALAAALVLVLLGAVLLRLAQRRGWAIARWPTGQIQRFHRK